MFTSHLFYQFMAQLQLCNRVWGKQHHGFISPLQLKSVWIRPSLFWWNKNKQIQMVLGFAATTESRIVINKDESEQFLLKCYLSLTSLGLYFFLSLTIFYWHGLHLPLLNTFSSFQLQELWTLCAPHQTIAPLIFTRLFLLVTHVNVFRQISVAHSY